MKPDASPAAVERLRAAIPSRVEPIAEIEKCLGTIFDGFEKVKADDKVSIQDCAAGDLDWRPFQLVGILERLINESVHRALTGRPVEPFVGALRRRLERALKFPTPEQAQGDDLQSEIDKAVETIVQ